MAYYYVKTGGTATGDAGRATSLRTGSFATMGASAYYATLDAAQAATTTPAAHDFIIVSDSIDVTDAAPFPAGFAIGVIVVSVSDTNADTPTKGARYSGGGTTENWTSGLGKHFTTHGFLLDTPDDSIHGAENAVLDRVGCEFNFGTGTNDAIGINVPSSVLNYIDCEINLNTASGSQFQLASNSKVYMRNCTNTNTASSVLFSSVATEQVFIEIEDTDLTQFISASGNIFASNFGAAGPWVQCSIKKCKLPSGLGITSGTKTPGHWNINITECKTGDVDGYYGYYYENESGTAEIDTVQYITSVSPTYDGTNNFTTAIDTTSYTNVLRPFRYKLGTIPASDLATANQKIVVELNSATSGLTDVDVWLEVEKQDDTDQSLGVLVSTRQTNFLTAGTALTTSTVAWVTANTKYKIEAALGAHTNVDNSNVTVYVCVAKPSITVNANAPTLDAA